MAETEQGTKQKIGRPSSYSQELSDKICARLAQGESMRSVSRDADMPAMTTLFKWLRENETFAQQYAQAKVESADAMAEEIMDISDNGSNDWMEKHYGDQDVWVTNGEALQRSRLRVDTRKWLMAKMKPKKYGDRINTDITTDGEKIQPASLPDELVTKFSDWLSQSTKQ